MENKKAIKHLEVIKGDCALVGDIRALDMAISALSENKGDLISRQAVENITWEEPSYTDPLNVLTEVREKIRALPSAENKGEWIKTKDQYETYHFTCSKCGNDIATKSDAWNDNFCSECGAYMRGE